MFLYNVVFKGYFGDIVVKMVFSRFFNESEGEKIYLIGMEF